MKKPRSFENTREMMISIVFSNAGRVLSQCNTRLRLLYLLIEFIADAHAKQYKSGPFLLLLSVCVSPSGKAGHQATVLISTSM